MNNKISCIASCVAQNIVRRFVFRVSPFERETRYFARYSKRHTIFCAIHEATHDILRDTQSYTRYFARYTKRHAIFTTIYRLLGYLHKGDISWYILARRFVYRAKYRVSLRVSRKIYCIALSNAQNIVCRFVCRAKYRVSLRVSCVALDERRARL